MLSQTDTGTAIILIECSSLDALLGRSAILVESEEVDSPLLNNPGLAMEYLGQRAHKAKD